MKLKIKKTTKAKIKVKLKKRKKNENILKVNESRYRRCGVAPHFPKTKK